MASQPDMPAPDRIDPQSPPETPASPSPVEMPVQQPSEITPVGPDHDTPDVGLPETPPPPD